MNTNRACAFRDGYLPIILFFSFVPGSHLCGWEPTAAGRMPPLHVCQSGQHDRFRHRTFDLMGHVGLAQFSSELLQRSNSHVNDFLNAASPWSIMPVIRDGHSFLRAEVERHISARKVNSSDRAREKSHSLYCNDSWCSLASFLAVAWILLTARSKDCLDRKSLRTRRTMSTDQGEYHQDHHDICRRSH